MFLEPWTIFLATVCIIIAYLIYRVNIQDEAELEHIQVPPRLEPFPKGDMTLEELAKYDGVKSSDGRVLLAVKGEIYDVTKGSRFYGPEGPYAALAGRDATRALATFQLDLVKETWDDTSDLTESEMSNVIEWQEQFKEKYDYIGNLVK